MTVYFPTFTQALLNASERIAREPTSTYIVEKHGKRFCVSSPPSGPISRLFACIHKPHAPKTKSLISEIEQLTILTPEQLEAVKITARRTYAYFGLKFPHRLFSYLEENPTIRGPAQRTVLKRLIEGSSSLSPSTATVVSSGETEASAAAPASPVRRGIHFTRDPAGPAESPVVTEVRLVTPHRGIHHKLS